MKKIILIISTIIFSFININLSFAENIDGLGDITSNKTTTTLNKTGSNISENAKSIAWEIIDIVRYVFAGVLIIFLVYAGAQMIMSMGTNEDDLSKSKRTFWYSMIGLVFIIFPIEIYNIFIGKAKGSNDFFIVSKLEDITMYIINFLEIIVIGIAIFMIVLTGIKIITSRGKEDQLSEAKNKIIWVIVALLFIGFIEVWRNFLIGGSLNGGNFKLSDGISIFQSIANLLLYIAGPIALFFLTLAGYYYIIANGDEEKTKKGKNIVINTLIGVIILLCAYVLLNDLSLLTI